VAEDMAVLVFRRRGGGFSSRVVCFARRKQEKILSYRKLILLLAISRCSIKRLVDGDKKGVAK